MYFLPTLPVVCIHVCAICWKQKFNAVWEDGKREFVTTVTAGLVRLERRGPAPVQPNSAEWIAILLMCLHQPMSFRKRQCFILFCLTSGCFPPNPSQMYVILYVLPKGWVTMALKLYWLITMLLFFTGKSCYTCYISQFFLTRYLDDDDSDSSSDDDNNNNNNNKHCT